MYFHYIPLHFTPDRGFCEAVCDCKVSNNFFNSKTKYAKKHIKLSSLSYLVIFYMCI